MRSDPATYMYLCKNFRKELLIHYFARYYANIVTHELYYELINPLVLGYHVKYPWWSDSTISGPLALGWY